MSLKGPNDTIRLHILGRPSSSGRPSTYILPLSFYVAIQGGQTASAQSKTTKKAETKWTSHDSRRNII